MGGTSDFDFLRRPSIKVTSAARIFVQTRTGTSPFGGQIVPMLPGNDGAAATSAFPMVGRGPYRASNASALP
jgi:hypothetical protein